MDASHHKQSWIFPPNELAKGTKQVFTSNKMAEIAKGNSRVLTGNLDNDDVKTFINYIDHKKYKRAWWKNRTLSVAFENIWIIHEKYTIINQLGYCHYHLKHCQQSIDIHTKTLTWLVNEYCDGNSNIKIQVMKQLASSHYRLGNSQKCRDFCHEVLEILKENNQVDDLEDFIKSLHILFRTPNAQHLKMLRLQITRLEFNNLLNKTRWTNYCDNAGIFGSGWIFIL
jgi:hypothetical protein